MYLLRLLLEPMPEKVRQSRKPLQSTSQQAGAAIKKRVRQSRKPLHSKLVQQSKKKSTDKLYRKSLFHLLSKLNLLNQNLKQKTIKAITIITSHI